MILLSEVPEAPSIPYAKQWLEHESWLPTLLEARNVLSL
jgi:hypothetical protein